MNVTSRGHEIHYEARGDGPGLLLIHGVLQSSQRWIDCGFPDEYAGSFRVVMPDLLGHGQSDKPVRAAEYTVDGLVTDLVSVLDAEGLDRVHVWGYSGGSICAARLAEQHPERVESLIIGGIPPNIDGDARRAFAEPWIDALRSADWELFWERFLPLSEATKLLLQEENDPIAIAAFVEGIAESTSMFRRVDVPTLCYEGTDELFFDLAEATAREMGATFIPIEGRGHDGAFARLDLVSPAVGAFLRPLAASRDH